MYSPGFSGALGVSENNPSARCLITISRGAIFVHASLEGEHISFSGDLQLPVIFLLVKSSNQDIAPGMASKVVHVGRLPDLG
jgi:hypothetical protein